jgi:hypothetical protein
MINKMSPRRILRFLISLGLLLFLTTSHVRDVYSLKTGTLHDEEILVLYEEPLRGAAVEAAQMYPIVMKELEKDLEWGITFRPTLLLIKNRSTFKGLAGSNLIVAYAVPQKKLIVIDYSKMKTDPFKIEVTLKHELCHLLLHHHIQREKLPKWLDEGIAQWVSGGIAELLIDKKGSLLDAAILSGKYISIRALTNRFPRERNSFMLAYEESKSLTEYIVRQYGRDGLLMVLGYLKDGDEVDQAILKGLSISLDELEEKWLYHLKKRTTWITYLINHLYEILFFLAAVSFIRVLMKKRAYKEYEEEDDNLYS